jgi:hypothetical protein
MRKGHKRMTSSGRHRFAWPRRLVRTGQGPLARADFEGRRLRSRKPLRMTRALSALALFAIGVGFPISGYARCESGNQPSYDDIEAIMLAQDGRGGRIGIVNGVSEAVAAGKRF